MTAKYDGTTLVVKDADGKPHIIHSDEFGIHALMDVLQKAAPDAKDAARYRFIRSGETYNRGKLFIAREGPEIIRVTLEYADQLIDEAMGGNGN